MFKKSYIHIQSLTYPNRGYIGTTFNLKDRLKSHNEGRSPHTAKFKPWQLVTHLAFSDKTKAVDFEQYLKYGSAHAFAGRRLW
jgi:predicted GIY-YIG superfamily endonuclease